ncbi:hypothetical protein SAMN05660690_2546 [Geodermatophilus telluris]|uniref:Uncharacterized protein n=1 Tax=Geodermatophilus telluris TaxID=1190417 RepID=A0A1G6PED0_9ACTN|nr:hypothetical protein [Geodermatophilus telluris]SDC78600.1 hypothetical protein SAMN05660690_2546 [Geodermatophilus telluris]
MTTTGRRHSLPIDPQVAADWQAMVANALRAGADSPTPGPLLATAAMLLGIPAGAMEPAVTATVVRGIAAWDRPECSAGAVATAALTGDEGLRREMRRAAADRGHALPRWLAELHRAEPVSRAVELSGPFRDVDELVVGATVPGGHALTAVVRVDNELGSRAVGGVAYEERLDDVVARIAGGTPDLSVRDIAPADARARLTGALRGPDLDALLGREAPWPRLRPLVRWLVARLPSGGDATVPGAVEDVDLDDVAAAFLASPWGRPWTSGHLAPLLEAVLGDGLANGLGDPLSWAPHHVARLLDPQSSALLDVDAGRAPELLRDLVRYGHAERGLRPGLTDETLAAIDRCSAPFLSAVRSWQDEGR